MSAKLKTADDARPERCSAYCSTIAAVGSVIPTLFIGRPAAGLEGNLEAQRGTHGSPLGTPPRHAWRVVLNPVFTGSHLPPKDCGHSGLVQLPRIQERQETVRRETLVRRGAPIAAALALGGGAGAAIYAASPGSS